MNGILEPVKRIWLQFIALPTVTLEGILWIPLFIFGSIFIIFGDTLKATWFGNFCVLPLFPFLLGLPFWLAIFRREFIGHGVWKGISAVIFGIIAVTFLWGLAFFLFLQAIIGKSLK